MNLDEIQIQSVVEQVVRRLVAEREAPAVIAPPARYENKGDDGLFDDLEEAIAAASEAQRALEAMSLEQRRELISAIRRESMAHSKGIAQKTVEETGMGKVPHKIRKLEVVVQHTPGVEDLQPTAWTGDNGLTVVEMAPFGVIAAVTPSTHPVPTMVNNAISFVAAGNSAVFAPHPSAKDVSALGLQMLNRAIVGAGGPPNLLVAVREPSIETAQTLFVHPVIDLVLVTGGGGVVKAAMQAPKRVIAAGPGNPPVVVDETADIEKAALGIIEG
ncbi:MAG: aldehyde dehydrogenase family protein, partial [Gemmatimonadota bacterium]|nr:aldehyde dehydrogenase family protein [Gemmatimonadota bacterium]